MTNLWNYILGMSLSDRNKQWLADKLIESKSKNMQEQIALEHKIRRGRQEISRGECTTCATKEDLNSFLESL